MRIDAGLIIGIALEFVIMLYFANSTLQPKKNYYMSSAICFIGYLIIFGVSIFNMFIFNIISFTIIDFLIFIFSYNAGYAKRRGVEKPSFLVLGVFKAASAQSELWRPVLQ